MMPNSVRASTVRYLWLVGIAVITAASGMSQPTITSVKNAASFDAAIPRGCLISVFGSKLARAPASATSLPLPGKLEDAALLVGDLELPAPLSSSRPHRSMPCYRSRRWATRYRW